MDFDAHAHTAVDIVNAVLATMADLAALPGAGHPLGTGATERDLSAVRRAQRRLREVFEHGATGRDASAVAELNALLEAFPVRPRIEPAGSAGWQLQVTGRGSAASAEYLAGAVWGLAVWLCEHGASRFGICADERCRNVFLDTSTNCCRRFCSERCATRSHVAAHRARKRATAPAPGRFSQASRSAHPSGPSPR